MICLQVLPATCWLESRAALMRQLYRGCAWPSSWNRRQEGDDAVRLVQSGEMPPLQYKIMHKSGRLSAAERDALVQGLRASLGG